MRPQMTKIYFDTTLQDIDLSTRFAANPGAPRWLADHDTPLAITIESRNARLVAHLCAKYSDLTLDKESLEPEDYADEQLGQSAVLARYQRARILDGDWQHGTIRIAIFDGQMEVAVYPDVSTQEKLYAFQKSYVTLLAELCEISGMTPLQPDASTSADISALVQSMVDSAGPRIKRIESRARYDATLRFCAIPGTVLFGLLAIGLALVLLGLARDEGILAAGVNPTKEFIFVTEYQRPINRHFGVMREFTLQGHIRDHSTSFALKVYRDEYLRSGPGALFNVVATMAPETPFLLQKRYENALPVVSLFGNTYSWSALLALLPVTLWYFLFPHPLLRAHRGLRPVVHRQIGIRAVVLCGFSLLLPVLLFIIR